MAEKSVDDHVDRDKAIDGQLDTIVSPVSPASRYSHASSLSPTTEPRRWSQFAEHQTCPLPQLAVDPDGGAPEPLSNLDLHREECSSAHRDDDSASRGSARPVVEPDFSDQRSAAIVYAEPDRSWVSKNKSYIIAGLVVALIALTGVTVGVVVTQLHKNSSGGGGASTGATPASSSSSSLSSTTTSTSSVGSSTSTPSACASSDDFISRVSWMGIENAAGGWKAAYSAARDAAACCSICYESQPSGCDGWAWMPVAGSPGTACNMIVGYAGEDNDTTCPSGHTGVTLSTDSSDTSYVGGAGPCATLAS